MATLAFKPVPASQPHAADHVSTRTWLCVLGVLLGCFMAVLNIVLTNSSLRDIAGTLGASSDEISWVPTSYLVAEIVVIPLTAWLAQAFSLKRYLLVNSILFLFFSICCGQARSLELMIIFRILQGFSGGVLIPLSFSVILNYLPPSKHPVGMALFSITATFAPAIGPLIGGWLTDAYGWPFIFYLNVLPCLLLIAAVWFTMDAQPTQLALLKRGDWIGIISMAIGLGSLEIVLEDGNRKDWFGDPGIAHLTWIAIIFISIFVINELLHKEPLVDLRLFGRRNFGLGSMINVVLGMGLYGVIYLIPIYLGQMQGYNAFQIGTVIIWMGLPQLVIIPFIPTLMQRFDSRFLIGFGMLLFGGSCFLTSYFNRDFSGPQIHLPLLIRAIGQPFIMVPLSAVATAGMAKGRESGAASALFNMLRNMGGSFAIAGLSTLLSVRERFHSLRIGESVSIYSEATRDRLQHMTDFFMSRGADSVSAQASAVGSLGFAVRQQSFFLAYNDCFVALGFVLLASASVLFFMKKQKTTGGGGAH
jgi:MFS transporter, DHA2 family, multidrug resistance protein